jgi:hypothetical protein
MVVYPVLLFAYVWTEVFLSSTFHKEVSATAGLIVFITIPFCASLIVCGYATFRKWEKYD